jgi:hypothetical protein
VTSGANRVLIYDSTTNNKLIDTNGNEVYGRITESGGVYTLSYFVEVAGVETAFTMTAGTIDFLFPYRFTFTQFPSDAPIRVQSSFVGEDPVASG